MNSMLCRVGLHRRSIRLREGADHTGLDAWMICHCCRRRTSSHIETVAYSSALERALAAEWHRSTTLEAIDQ